MPIVTRTLDSVQPSTAGTILAGFLAIDTQDRPFRRSSARFVDEVAAVVASDGFDWMDQLKDLDFDDLLVWTQAPAKNDPSAFDFGPTRDLTLLEGEDRLFTHFAESVGEIAILLAWWIKGLNPPTFNTIRDRLGLNITDGDRVKDRAVALDDGEATFNDIVEIG